MPTTFRKLLIIRTASSKKIIIKDPVTYLSIPSIKFTKLMTAMQIMII